MLKNILSGMNNIYLFESNHLDLFHLSSVHRS